MTFRVGQKVICVNDKFDCLGVGDYPIKGEIYTIRWIGERATDGGPGVMLDEIFGGWFAPDIEFCFCVKRFRPLTETKSSQSFTTGAPKDSERWDNRRKVRERAQ